MREVSDMIEENISTSLANSISKDNNPDLDNFSKFFICNGPLFLGNRDTEKECFVLSNVMYLR